MCCIRSAAHDFRSAVLRFRGRHSTRKNPVPCIARPDRPAPPDRSEARNYARHPRGKRQLRLQVIAPLKKTSSCAKRRRFVSRSLFVFNLVVSHSAGMSTRKATPICKFLPLDTIEFKQLRSDLLTGFGGRITASKLVSTPIPLHVENATLNRTPSCFHRRE